FARIMPNGDIAVRRVQDDREIARVPISELHADWLNALSAGSRFLIFSTSWAKHCVWDLARDEMAFRDLDLSRGLALPADGDSLATLEPNGVISVYDFGSRQVFYYSSRVSSGSAAMCLDPKSSRLACFNCQTLKLEIVEIKTGTVTASMTLPDCCQSVAWSSG